MRIALWCIGNPETGRRLGKLTWLKIMTWSKNTCTLWVYQHRCHTNCITKCVPKNHMYRLRNLLPSMWESFQLDQSRAYIIFPHVHFLGGLHPADYDLQSPQCSLQCSRGSRVNQRHLSALSCSIYQGPSHSPPFFVLRIGPKRRLRGCVALARTWWT